MVNLATSSVAIIDLVNLSKDVAVLNLGYLTVSVTIIALLGGAFIYFNIRPLRENLEKQENAIEELRNEASSIIKSSEEQTNIKLMSFEDRFIKEVMNKVKTENEKTSLEIKSKLSELAKENVNTTEKISESKDKKQYEIISSELRSQILTLEEKLSSTHKKEIDPIKKSLMVIKDLKTKIKELELYKFAKENQMGAIYRAIELLKDDISDQNEWKIPDRLGTLDKQIDGINLEPDLIVQIEEQLNRISNENKYQPLIKSIRNKFPQNK